MATQVALSESDILSDVPPELLARITELGKGLTQKQKLLVLGKLKGLNGVQAAKAAGYGGNNESLAGTAAETVRNPRVVPYMAALAEACGLDDLSVLRRLRQGMDAMRVELDRNGNAVELGPDWQNRTKVLELTLKMKGAFPDPKLQVTGADGGAIVVRHTAQLQNGPD